MMKTLRLPSFTRVIWLVLLVYRGGTGKQYGTTTCISGRLTWGRPWLWKKSGPRSTQEFDRHWRRAAGGMANQPASASRSQAGRVGNERVMATEGLDAVAMVQTEVSSSSAGGDVGAAGPWSPSEVVSLVWDESNGPPPAVGRGFAPRGPAHLPPRVCKPPPISLSPLFGASPGAGPVGTVDGQALPVPESLAPHPWPGDGAASDASLAGTSGPPSSVALSGEDEEEEVVSLLQVESSARSLATAARPRSVPVGVRYNMHWLPRFHQ